MLVMHISGAFAPAILDPSEISSSDYVVPTLVLKYMNPVVAGLFIAAPLSAVMSTVSSLLILASAAIIKDIYLNYIAKEKGNVDKTDAKFEKKIGKMSMITTLFVGVIVFVFTIYPPDLIVWINLFAMGGLECAFLCPILFGLYWKRANATGAVLSSVIGVVSFLLMTTYKVSIFGTTPIVPSIVISIVVFVIGSLIGKKPDEEIMKLFYS